MSNIITYKDYHAAIEYSSEDQMLVGSVIGVQDCLNFHGFSIEELTQSFHSCIDGYLEMCEALGRSPDKEYKGSFNVRIPSETHRAADIQAKKEGVSLNQFVQAAIEDKLKSASNQTMTYILIDSTPSRKQAFFDRPNQYSEPIPLTQS